LVETVKRFYRRFLKLRGTSQQIAKGMALGLFIGMTPFLGFHTAMAIMFASLFKWSKIAAGLGVFITNPLTAPVIYTLTYRLGVLVTGFSDHHQWLKLFEPGGVIGLVKSSPMIIVDMLVGGGIIGLPLSIVGYYVTFAMVSSARNRMQRRRARRLSRRAKFPAKRAPENVC
jgi:uncharacterized protein (DUF2062 family)